MRSPLLQCATLALALTLCSACSDGSSDGGVDQTTSLQSVTFGPATAAHPGGTIGMAFDGPMMTGMEQYVDLHRGDITGPELAMTCDWSADGHVLTCLPGAPLEPGVTYTLHMGAGMRAGDGTPVDMTAGLGMGGTWMTAGMTGMHNGGMTGPGWEDDAGHDGMLFTFTPT